MPFDKQWLRIAKGTTVGFSGERYGVSRRCERSGTRGHRHSAHLFLCPSRVSDYAETCHAAQSGGRKNARSGIPTPLNLTIRTTTAARPTERISAHATHVLVRRRRTETPTDEGVSRTGNRIVLDRDAILGQDRRAFGASQPTVPLLECHSCSGHGIRGMA